MKNTLLARFGLAAARRKMVTFAVFLLPVLAVGLSAETQRGGQFNGCVNANYGGAYNWLQFVNGCNQPLHITWFWRDRDYVGSSSDNIQPGSAALTGESSSEVQGHGGYEVYICPAGFLPVNGFGALITNGGSNPQDYACKRQ